MAHPLRVVELRNYRLYPGRRDELIALFEREFVEPQEAAGMRLLGLFHDAQDADRFVWIRGFADMDRRKEALGHFYDGPVWRHHREAANATMADSDDVLLLRPVRSDAPLLRDEAIDVRGPLLCSMQLFPRATGAEAAAGEYERSALRLPHQGGRTLGTFVTESAANSFPRLPVREGEHAFVAVTSGLSREVLRAQLASAKILDLVPTARSRVQLLFSGEPGDFDFLAGMTTVTHRKLRERLRGSVDWESATGAYRCITLAGGVVSVDEMDLPAAEAQGCSIRHLDIAARRWTIYWTTSRTGGLLPPVHGGFRGDRGEFYGIDVENGTHVLTRYIWANCATQRPRWEQAFSTDGGLTWETNWIMEFARP